ncbi:hypothetical protein KP79_PYT22798 [Mizuhopecten yessoensis]|uniref:Uncharacterized protein n=1 Tax=Mizuhopecten yessoensis TaxID=6573 RepID=A0A210PFN9_MIZYE|nr:hypothetical protein KP79_PYT22798 [Mizuhopecten yessoensis]
MGRSVYESVAPNIYTGASLCTYFSWFPQQTQKQQLSIDQWTTCFTTFIAIYIIKSPKEAANLGSMLRQSATLQAIMMWHGDIMTKQFIVSDKPIDLPGKSQ